jgi:DNA-binding NtrC family response regulator
MPQKRILIVDDETGFLMALRKILQSAEVMVDTAETFDAAMELLGRRSYSVVIADIRLTVAFREEGFEILHHVKTSDPRTRVIILTAYGQADMKKKALALGADLFIEKPAPPRVLQEALKSYGVECC